MVHLATEAASAPIGQDAAVQASAPARPWPMYRTRNGAPRWFQRWLEAFWIVTGKWSLHRAWQHGLDDGSRNEFRRVVINGGDLMPIMNATIYATRAAMPGGARPTDEEMCDLRRKAWGAVQSASIVLRGARSFR